MTFINFFLWTRFWNPVCASICAALEIDVGATDAQRIDFDRAGQDGPGVNNNTEGLECSEGVLVRPRRVADCHVVHGQRNLTSDLEVERAFRSYIETSGIRHRRQDPVLVDGKITEQNVQHEANSQHQQRGH